MEKIEEVTVDIRDYIQEYWYIIKKRSWTIFTVALIIITIVTIGVFFIRPTYRATAEIQIERKTPNVLSFEEIYAMDSSQQSFYQTQIMLIKSKSIAKKVIDKMSLLESPQFANIGKTNMVRRVKRILRLESVDTNREEERYSHMIKVFNQNLLVEPKGDSQIISISFINYDPKLAADVANTVAESFIESSLEAKYQTAKQAYDFLNKQIQELINDIGTKEEEMQQYAHEKDILSLDGSENIVVQQLVELNAEYTRVQTRRIEKESIYRQVINASADAIPEVIKNSLIQQLKAQHARLENEYAEKSERFKAEYPEMIQLKSRLDQAKERLDEEINDIVSKVRNSARGEYQAALKQEQSIKEMLDQQTDRTADLHKNAVMYNNIKTEVDNKRALLQALTKRQNEAGVSADLRELGSGYIRIVDRADIPREIYKPDKKSVILLSIIVGLFLGTGFAFFLEYSDNSLKNKEEVERYIKLPTIGIIPSLDGMRKATKQVYAYEDYTEGKRDKLPESIEKIVHTNIRSTIAESYGSLRTSILLSSPNSPPQAILVTSSQPKEGKTATAINIAIALSQLDKRTVLIDTDLRKPRIAEIFQRQSNGVGISNYLTGSASLNEIIHKTKIPNLFIIPSGPTPPNPAVLFTTPKMESLLESCKQTFNFIVLDSPPLLAVTDAQLLANKVDGVILIVHGGLTPRNAVQDAKEKLHSAKIFGVVLNQIPLDKYGYYSKRYYNYYHKERDKKLFIRMGEKK